MADAIPTLSISTEKICFVVLKAREFDVKDADTSSDEDGSNPADDRMVEVLEDRPDDPVDQELVAFIEAMSEDEQVDLVTLTWLGRGDGGLDDWDDLTAEAARVHNRRTVAGDEPRRDLAMTPYPSISPSAGADPSSRRAIAPVSGRRLSDLG